MESSRFERGSQRLASVVGDASQQVVAALASISPDFARYTVEFSYGDVYMRPGLDLRSREIAAVAALTALGHSTLQLKVHVNGALNVGCTPQEIIEVIIQMVLYVGFPAATNALLAAKEVFVARGIAPLSEGAG